MFHQHWVTVPVPEQQSSRGRTTIIQQSMDIAIALTAVMALVPPNLSNLTCNQGAPERQCAGLGVPTSLEQIQGIYVNV